MVQWVDDCGELVELRLDGTGEIPTIVAVSSDSLVIEKPKSRQVGGDHYQGFAIQPIDFIQQNNLNFLEGCVVKRICRHRAKNGREDLEKIIHEVQLLIDHEYPE